MSLVDHAGPLNWETCPLRVNSPLRRDRTDEQLVFSMMRWAYLNRVQVKARSSTCVSFLDGHWTMTIIPACSAIVVNFPSLVEFTRPSSIPFSPHPRLPSAMKLKQQASLLFRHRKRPYRSRGIERWNRISLLSSHLLIAPKSCPILALSIMPVTTIHNVYSRRYYSFCRCFTSFYET